MLRKPFPHFIIISGSGKKVGKTFMATALILQAKSFTTTEIIDRISFIENCWEYIS